ncbi:MAG: hypothetical protein AAF726_13125 [Planctomycetota bacterium]
MSRSPAFVLESELTPARFAEVGRPGGAFCRADGGFVALTSSFDRLYWPARAVYAGHRIRHRVSLYDGELTERIAVFDGAEFSIHDVAFHPRRSVVAIATGDYDGGWMFEGALLLWNWQTGESISVLSESREVTRVRFREDGSLDVLLSPRDEGDPAIEDDPFETYLGGTLSDLRPFQELGLRASASDPRVAGFTAVEPARLGFDVGSLSDAAQDRAWRDVLGGREFEQRHRVWDVDWSEPERILAVHDECLVEAWTPGGDRSLRIQSSERRVQVLRTRDRAIVNALTDGERAQRPATRSTLYEVGLASITQVTSFDEAVLCSTDSTGRVLCRDTGDPMRSRTSRDRILDPSLRTVWSGDLGHYDCFNHHLRVDGGEGLFFLEGSPSSKVLCRWSNAKVVERCSWDVDGVSYLNAAACLARNDLLVRFAELYDPDPNRFVGSVDGLDLRTGARKWTRSISAPATTLALLGDRLVYGLTDGAFGAMDAATGETLYEERLQVDGVDSVVLSLAAQGDRVACGTIDGRLLVFRSR